MKLPIKVEQTIEVSLPIAGRLVACDAEILAVMEKAFTISFPKRKGVLIPVEVDPIAVCISTPDAIFTMACHVEVLTAEGITLTIPPPEEIQRLQRRKYLRVRAKMPCLIEAEQENGEEDFKEGIAGVLMDLSGGGCAAIFNQNVPKEKMVRLTLELPDEGKTILMGKVIRSTIVRTPHGPSFQLSIEFRLLSEVDRAKLIRQVFSIQRRMAWRAAPPS